MPHFIKGNIALSDAPKDCEKRLVSVALENANTGQEIVRTTFELPPNQKSLDILLSVELTDRVAAVPGTVAVVSDVVTVKPAPALTALTEI